MTIRAKKIVTISTVLLILFGIAIRVYFAVTQPLWLDEQYSLFFSQSYSSSQLLLFFKYDVHPGMYYFFVKIVSVLFSSNVAIRLVTSVLPEVLGFGVFVTTLSILHGHFFKNKSSWLNKNTTYLTFIFTTLYFLNPFIIDLSWQIRMYGLLLLFAALSVHFFIAFIIHKNIKTFLPFLITCLLGMATSYSFSLLTFCLTAVLVFWIKTQTWKRILLLYILTLLLAGYFLLLSGYSNRSQIEYANWIATPNLQNIPSTYTTLLGFGTNLHAVASTSTLQLVIDYSIFFIILIALFCIAKFSFLSANTSLITKKNLTKIKELFLFAFIFPLSAIFIASFLLPFLSNRFFFYTFVPNISLFLPRMHAVLMPLFWMLISIAILVIFGKLNDTKQVGILQIFTSKKFLPYLFFSLFFLLYIPTITSIYFQRLETVKAHTLLKEVSLHTDSIIPEWIHYLSITNSEYLMDHTKLSSQIHSSKVASTKILQNNDDCSVTQGQSFAFFLQFFTKNHEKELLISHYENCCPSDKKNTSNELLLCD